MRIALFFLTACLYAEDFSGIWTGQIPTRNNDTQEISFQFIQEGSKISGKLYGDYKSMPIIEGKISGNVLAFVVPSQEQAGNQINETRFRFSGRMVDGTVGDG